MTRLVDEMQVDKDKQGRPFHIIYSASSVRHQIGQLADADEGREEQTVEPEEVEEDEPTIPIKVYGETLYQNPPPVGSQYSPSCAVTQKILQTEFPYPPV